MARRTQFKLSMPVVPEHSLQAVLTRTLTLEIAPPGKLSRFGVLWFSIDMANFAGEVPGVRIGRGIIAGVPDVLLFHIGRGFLIELKAEDGQLTEAQMEVIAAATFAGVKCAVADSVDAVLRILDEWSIPRRRRVMFQMPKEEPM